MKLYKRFEKRPINPNRRYDTIELQYSQYHRFSGNKLWFCRLWVVNWIEIRSYNPGWFFGDTKYEAWRGAEEDMKQKLIK